MGKVKKIELVKVNYYLTDLQKLPTKEDIKVIHTSGHYADQVALLWENHNLLFAADTCTNIGKLRLSPVYENIETGKKGLYYLSTEKFKIACFGHGKPIMTNAAKEFSKKWR